ncbi:MAG: NAD(P)H-hydrate dehydratase [Clostridia bacterium]
MYCVTNETMRESDRATIQNGVSSVELVSRAARAVWGAVQEWKGKIYIICGKGNNGGDGICLTNVLLENGCEPYVFLTEKEMSDEAKYFVSELEKKKFANIFDIDKCDFQCDIIVDCIFGTGFRGNLTEKYQDIINKINGSGAQIISVDIPSGLNGDNGLSCKIVASGEKDKTVDGCLRVASSHGICVVADKTIAIQALKLGHFVGDGKDVCGELCVVDIGIDIVGEKIEIIDENIAKKCFSARKNNTHKANYGKSIVIGGCDNYCGAVKLANLGATALRVGGGYNVLALPQNLQKELFSVIEESITFGLSESGGNIIFCQNELEKLIDGANCVAIGMGIGSNYSETLKVLRFLLSKSNLSVVIDADALNALSTDIDTLSAHKAQVVVTPHPKEMARLCGLSVGEILANPLQNAKNFAEKFDAIVLLKGAATVIVDKKASAIVVNGSPAMAKGGNGDVLSGAIVGLLSQGNECFVSAEVGAYLCAKGASQASEIYSEYGVLPSDIAKEIAKIVKDY